MLILAIMAVGVLIGYRFLPKKLQKINTAIQLGCTVALVFCMGVTLGQRENFWAELADLGWWSLLLAVIPMGLSAILVWILTRIWEKRREDRKERN
ncbi:MAG: LysO family transporter [Candidatus Merdivicinus sp.]|jgi:uncharacterized membrane protein YbjE (DUF340 family)